MRKLLLLLICLVAFGACAGDPEGTVTLRESESPFVAFNIWVKVGSQNDAQGKEGLAAITAALLSDGSTTEDSYDEILAQLYPMAAGYGYNVDKEMTVFRGRIHIDNLEQYYTLFSNSLLHPAFNAEDFERVKTQTMNYLERGRRYGRDEELSKELLFRELYRGTPYEHPEEGYVSSVESITLDDIRVFYNTYYVSNNIVVGIAGGYPDGFVERVREDFNTLPEGEITPVAKAEPAMPDGIHVLIVQKQTQSSPVSMGFPLPFVRGDDDYFPMMAMNAWFGEHRSSFSHLYQVIRERRGMNYGDYSYIEAFPLGYTTQDRPINIARRHHPFEIWIRPISNTEPGNLNERVLFGARAALRELNTIVDEGMTEEALETTKEYLHNFTVNYGSTISRRLAYAIDDEFYGIRGGGFLTSIRPGLASLSIDQVNDAISRTLQYDNMHMVFITNDAEGMKQMLLSGVPTRIGYNSEQSADHMAEDDLIANFPIPVTEENITIIDIDEVFEQ